MSEDTKAKQLWKGDLLIGRCVHYPDGWRFLPNTCAHGSSRKGWPTPEAAIPRWAKKMNGELR